jgi:peptide chain release factor 1
MEKKLQEIAERYEELNSLMSDPDVVSNRQQYEGLAREFSKLTRLMEVYRKYQETMKRIDDDNALLEDEDDEELLAMAREEIDELTAQRDELEEKLKELLLEPDPSDEKNIIMEIRAGTGGGEASLFVADLYRMYGKFADRMGWKIEVMDTNPTEIGGLREIVFGLSNPGDGVYRAMKYENGVHRVQRVPETESSGRIHTSAASVVVLPEADEVEMEIEEADLRVDVYRSSGPGGQSVNTTDSAVRITHIPTGLVVQCQDEKSQHKNKKKALMVLRARLLDVRMKEQQEEVGAMRRKIVGSGDRSEKIRTYNYPQGRVTDHRINLTLYRLEEIMDGDIDTLIESLRKADVDERMSSVHS